MAGHSWWTTWLAAIVLMACSCSTHRYTLQPRITVTEQYSDNVFLSSDNPQADSLTSVTPGITVGVQGKHDNLELEYSPSFTYYATTLEDLVTRHAANLRATRELSRSSSIEVTDRFLHTDDPVETPELAFTGDPPQIDTTIRTERRTYWTNSTNARYRYQFGPEDEFLLTYLHSILENEDPVDEDSVRHEPGFEVTYWLNSTYGVGSQARYTRGDFSLDTDSFNRYYTSAKLLRKLTRHTEGFVQYAHTSMDFEGADPDYQVHEATLGVDYELSERTFFTASGGYFVRDNSDADPDTGYLLRGDMARRFRHGSLRLTGAYGYDQAFFGAENLGFTEYYSANLIGRYDIFQHVSAEGSAGYLNNRYPDEEDREDTLYNFGAGLIYQFRPWMLMALRYAHHTVESTVPEDNYEENRVTFSITLTPATPILVGYW